MLIRQQAELLFIKTAYWHISCIFFRLILRYVKASIRTILLMSFFEDIFIIKNDLKLYSFTRHFWNADCYQLQRRGVIQDVAWRDHFVLNVPVHLLLLLPKDSQSSQS